MNKFQEALDELNKQFYCLNCHEELEQEREEDK